MSNHQRKQEESTIICTYNLFIEQYRRKGFLPENIKQQRLENRFEVIKDIDSKVLNAENDPSIVTCPWVNVWASWSKSWSHPTSGQSEGNEIEDTSGQQNAPALR